MPKANRVWQRRPKSIAQIVNDDKIDFMVMGSHGHKAHKGSDFWHYG